MCLPGDTVWTPGSQLNFFQKCLGMEADLYNPRTSRVERRMMTQHENNLDVAGSLPYPKNFTITGISFIPDVSADYEDVARFIDGAWFRLFIGCFDYQIAPSSLVSILPGKLTPGLKMRASSPLQASYSLPESIDLIPQQNFRAELNSPFGRDIKKPFNVLGILHGYFSRRIY